MIDSIRLQNFRSYRDYTTEFSSGVNIIVGPNASGKTNLLEAIYVINRGKSFRVSDAELIKHGSDWARIDSEGSGEKRVWKLNQGALKVEKVIELNANTHKRLSKEQQQPTTLFEPNHLRLLNGSPDIRRNYLDQTLSQTITGFNKILSRYQRTLRQRNSLLKQRNPSIDDIFVWDLKLSEYGGVINQERKELIAHINRTVSKSYSQIAESKTKIKLIYKDTVDSKDYVSGFLKELQSDINEDMRKGFTSKGPHREDFSIIMDDENSAVTASRGESRTLVLVLKLIELKLIEKQHEIKPILLLDDVFSELDGKRRRALTEHITGYQTMITTTDAEAVIEHFSTSEFKIIPLSLSN